MAYTETELSSAEQTNFAANKPIIGVNSAINNVHSDSRWVDGLGTTGSTDNTTSGFPVTRIADSKTNLVTKATSTGTTATLALRFSPGIDFDFVIWINHNLRAGPFTNMTMQIADNAAHSTNNIQIMNIADLTTYTSTDAERIAVYDLKDSGNAKRYTNVEYARFLIGSSSGTEASVGEIVFGRRRQLIYSPNRPWDPDSRKSGYDTNVTRSGIIHRAVKYKGAQTLDGSFWSSDSTEQSDINGFWEDVEYGAKPFIWSPDPSGSKQTSYYMFMNDDESSFPYTSHAIRVLDLEATEQGPHYVSDED